MAHGLFAHYSAQNGETYRGLTTIITMSGSGPPTDAPFRRAALSCVVCLKPKERLALRSGWLNVLGTNPRNRPDRGSSALGPAVVSSSSRDYDVATTTAHDAEPLASRH